MEITIGKSETCDYRINDDAISRIHCRIVFQQGALYIFDNRSTNGVYVDRKRIASQTFVSIQPDSDVLLSGIIRLDWGIVRRLIPGLHGGQGGGTRMVPQAEIDRSISQAAADRKDNRAAAPSPGPSSAPPAVQNAPQQGKPGINGNDLVYAVHSQKSFTGKAFFAFILYYLGFYLGGLIMNIVYLSEAKRSREVLGYSPPGNGCLVFLIITHFFIPLILIILALVLGVQLIEFFKTEILQSIF